MTETPQKENILNYFIMVWIAAATTPVNFKKLDAAISTPLHASNGDTTGDTTNMLSIEAATWASPFRFTIQMPNKS